MLADWLISWLDGVITGVLDFLPDWNPFDALPSIMPAARWLTDLNYFLPIGELFAISLGVLALGVPFITTSIVLWIYAQVRGSSSHG